MRPSLVTLALLIPFICMACNRQPSTPRALSHTGGHPSTVDSLSLAAEYHITATPGLELISFDHEIWSPRMSAAHVLFQDGAQSIPCPGGTLWLFGDTFTGLPTPANSTTPPAKELAPKYSGMLGCTIAFLPTPAASPLDASMPHPSVPSPSPLPFTYFSTPDGHAANPLPLLPGESPDLFRMWPLGGITLSGRTYIYYVMIQKTDGTAPWNFKLTGGGLAVSSSPLSAYTRLTPTGDWRFPVEPIQVIQRGDTLYLYQVRADGPLKGASLARVPAASIEDPAAYEFFSGLDAGRTPRWSREPSPASVVVPDAAGQISIAWNRHLCCWLGLTSSDFARPREIQFRTAPEPWGPWSAPTRLPIADKPGKTTDLIYCAALHPELSSPDGTEVAATFCRILKGDWELSNPELVRVRLR